MSYEPDPLPPPRPLQLTRERVKLPGIFLIVVGVLNGLAGGYLLFSGISSLRLSDQEIRAATQQAWDNLSPENKKVLTDKGITQQDMEGWMKVAGVVCLGWGGVGLVVGLLGVMGGSRMIALRSYGLGMTAAILTAVPFVSPLGCCLIGEVVGIWALIVLLSRDVQAAFRGNRAQPERDEGMLG